MDDRLAIWVLHGGAFWMGGSFSCAKCGDILLLCQKIERGNGHFVHEYGQRMFFPWESIIYFG